MSAASAILDRWFPREQLRRKFLERVRQRRGEVSLPFQFEYRNIFVVPTTFGWGFGLMLVFMALGGLNFNNNMALMLVFIFGVVAQLTTVLAYRNLVGIAIQDIQAEPVYCGDAARFRIFLSNPEVRARLTIRAGFRSLQECTDLHELASAVMVLQVETTRRGWLDMQPFKLETRYPLGMFRAWSWFFPRTRCLVYPRPAPNPPPLPRSGAGQGGRAQRGEGDQVLGIRPYRPGDSLKRVAWRSSARHEELYTREMEVPRDETCEISWNALPGMDVEQRLSVMTTWVLQAEQNQLPYSLVLPDGDEPPGLGTGHMQRCLERLALFE